MKIHKVSLFTRDGREHQLSITNSALRQLKKGLGSAKTGEIVVHNEAGDTIFRAPVSHVHTIFQVHN